MGWVLPTSHNDPNSDWGQEVYAYDNNTNTGALNSFLTGTWCYYLELLHASIPCSKIRYYVGEGFHEDGNLIDVDIYYSGAWHDVYQGTFTVGAYIEKSLGGTYNITKMRIRFYNAVSGTVGYRVYEAHFYDTSIAPTVTTQAVSDVATETATGNGNITATGGQNSTKRGVCWNTTGSPTTTDDKKEEDGNFGTGAFNSSMTGLIAKTKYYVKAYAINPIGTSYGEEVSFTTGAIVTTQSPTNVLPTTVTGNGNITSIGGGNATVRGFKYGLTKVSTWDAHDDGDFGAGAYTKGLTGLSANTTYWIRAYATNPLGTYYGDWVEFQTAAAGTIPTGTNLFICADLSGYSYQLMKSETDDGEEYTAYFVISTDLTNKQGLSFYKRILDLHLYFRSEDSGTATIYVKRDNEAEWQEVGSVSLTGTEDIIVKHLAPDIRAKVFLFKITAANFFRFLGCLFESLPEEMR